MRKLSTVIPVIQQRPLLFTEYTLVLKVMAPSSGAPMFWKATLERSLNTPAPVISGARFSPLNRKLPCPPNRPPQR